MKIVSWQFPVENGMFHCHVRLISGTTRRSPWVAPIKYNWSFQSSLETKKTGIYPVQKVLFGWTSHPERITLKRWSIENKYLKKGLLVAQKGSRSFPFPKWHHGAQPLLCVRNMVSYLSQSALAYSKNFLTSGKVQIRTLPKYLFRVPDCFSIPETVAWRPVRQVFCAHAFPAPGPVVTSCRVHGVDQRVLISRFITPGHCLSDSQGGEMAQHQLDRRSEKWEMWWQLRENRKHVVKTQKRTNSFYEQNQQRSIKDAKAIVQSEHVSNLRGPSLYEKGKISIHPKWTPSIHTS